MTALAILAVLAAEPYVPALSMKDQFGNVHDVRGYRGRVLVLVYGDRASKDANAALGEAIHIAFHPTAKGMRPADARRAPVKETEGGKKVEVTALPIACTGKVAVGQAMVSALVRAGSPSVPVLLDFEDRMRTMFPFSAGVPNVVVLDAEGRYRYAAAGKPTAEGMAKLLGTIEALRKEAAK
ncbi:MAG: hypothetical protein K2W96_27025 [Gemmataceae bacterium]|nr:hypothetical protein [Gemmataceae bacterium]